MIGIMAASEDELQPIIESMIINKVNEKSLVKFNIGTIDDLNVVSAFSGVCKVNAAIAIQNMIDLYNPKKIYITGVAGALDDKYKIGDTICFTKVAHHDMDTGILTEYHPFMETIWYNLSKDLPKDIANIGMYIDNIVTGEQFINPKNKGNIINKYEVHCVDMESASYAQVCYANKIPLIIIKTITDNTDEFGHNNFEENVKLCSKICAKKILELIAKS